MQNLSEKYVSAYRCKTKSLQSYLSGTIIGTTPIKQEVRSVTAHNNIEIIFSEVENIISIAQEKLKENLIVKTVGSNKPNLEKTGISHMSTGSTATIDLRQSEIQWNKIRGISIDILERKHVGRYSQSAYNDPNYQPNIPEILILYI